MKRKRIPLQLTLVNVTVLLSDSQWLTGTHTLYVMLGIVKQRPPNMATTWDPTPTVRSSRRKPYKQWMTDSTITSDQLTGFAFLGYLSTGNQWMHKVYVSVWNWHHARQCDFRLRCVFFVVEEVRWNTCLLGSVAGSNMKFSYLTLAARQLGGFFSSQSGKHFVQQPAQRNDYNSTLIPTLV